MESNNYAGNIRNSLQADCENCFGLCCVSLNFITSADFAIDKGAGTPCPNLLSDNRCAIHKSLRQHGFKGCTVFDCFGAGQKVSQNTFNGEDWRKSPEIAKKMFEVFPIMQELHEILWYLSDAISLNRDRDLHQKLDDILQETLHLTQLKPEELLMLDVPSHRSKVNTLLLQISELVRTENFSRKKNFQNKRKLNHRGADLIGANNGADLKGANLRGAYLIAADLRNADFRGADLIGADFRDAKLGGADLRKSIFLTQVQINSAKGNSQTKLPKQLSYPPHWNDDEK